MGYLFGLIHLSSTSQPILVMLKRLAFILLIPAPLLLVSCKGDPVEASFFTEGGCMECLTPILNALQVQKGVASVRWDYETSQTTVSYYPDEVDPEALQKALAEAGFRTEYFEPNPEARAALPACCQKPVERRLKQQLPTGH